MRFASLAFAKVAPAWGQEIRRRVPRAPDVGSGKLLAIIGLATVLLANRAMAESFVDVVKGRGYLTCGVGTGTPGFMQTDREGKWTGLAIDVCRAVSATILGDAGRAKFVPLDPIHHLSALQSGAVDLLTSNSAFTLARDAGLGVDFAGIYYYDGQGFMVPRKTRIRHFKELHRATICLQPGTTIESSLADHFRANNLTFRPLAIARSEDMRAAYLAGRCDAVTADFSTLHAMLAINPQQTDEHLILSQSIAKTPYSPAVRHGDTHFANVVRWALYAMIYAEELGMEGQQLGNFPQAFSHVALVNTALNIGRQSGPAGQRSKPDGSSGQPQH